MIHEVRFRGVNDKSIFHYVPSFRYFVRDEVHFILTCITAKTTLTTLQHYNLQD